MTVIERLRPQVIKAIDCLCVQFRKHTQKIALAILGLNAWWVMFAPAMPPEWFAVGNIIMAVAQWVAGGLPQKSVGTYDPRTTGTYDLATQRVIPLEDKENGVDPH